MPKKGKIDMKEKLISKTILAILSLVFAVAAYIAQNISFIAVSIFVMLFMASFGALIGIDKIRDFMSGLNDMDLW